MTRNKVKMQNAIRGGGRGIFSAPAVFLLMRSNLTPPFRPPPLLFVREKKGDFIGVGGREPQKIPPRGARGELKGGATLLLTKKSDIVERPIFRELLFLLRCQNGLDLRYHCDSVKHEIAPENNYVEVVRGVVARVVQQHKRHNDLDKPLNKVVNAPFGVGNALERVVERVRALEKPQNSPDYGDKGYRRLVVGQKVLDDNHYPERGDNERGSRLIGFEVPVLVVHERDDKPHKADNDHHSADYVGQNLGDLVGDCYAEHADDEINERKGVFDEIFGQVRDFGNARHVSLGRKFLDNEIAVAVGALLFGRGVVGVAGVCKHFLVIAELRDLLVGGRRVRAVREFFLVLHKKFSPIVYTDIIPPAVQ